MFGYVQVACNQRGRNASQLNIGGTSLGSFNDRFRDALMGGSPFASPRYQGYVTGLHTQSNSFTQVNIAALCLPRVIHQCFHILCQVHIQVSHHALRTKLHSMCAVLVMSDTARKVWVLRPMLQCMCTACSWW